MDSKEIILTLAGHDDLRLRSINNSDIENLRRWKNDNKQSFFLNQDISSEQQAKWFQAFSGREHDHMFIVEQKSGNDWVPIGCMGFRQLDDEGCVDGYNIIRAQKIEPASFTMSDAFRTMLAYAHSLYPELPIRVKVLAHNPAVEWYRKNDFKPMEQVKDYVPMELDLDSLKNINWTKQNKP